MDKPDNKGLPLAGFLLTFLGAILFSTKAIIVKLAFHATSTDPLSLLALRMLFSLPFYVGAAILATRRKANIRMNSRQWTFVIFLGLFGYYLSSLMDFMGLQYISAGLERLILFLYPSFTVLINRFLFNQKLVKSQVFALGLTYSGIVIAYLGEFRMDTGNVHFFLGSLLIFLCSITYSVYIVGSGQMIPRLGATKFTAYAMLSSITGILIHFILRGKYLELKADSGIWVYGILLALIATVIPSFLLSLGLKRIGSNNAAIVSSIGPVSTIVQAHFILGEKIFFGQILGTIFVIMGILLIGWKGQSAAPPN
jgi:drug/metabolite transporter (DMT)-like permease